MTHRRLVTGAVRSLGSGRRDAIGGLRFEKSEVVFAACVVGLAVLVGMTSPPEEIAWQILIVLWSALVGMMIPRIIDRRRGEQQHDLHPEFSGQPSLSQPGGTPDEAELSTIRHDMASALMAIEGGVHTLRHLHSDDESPRAESIAHAIEIEIRRIRRLTLRDRHRAPRCSVAETISPLVELHQANGAVIDYRLVGDGLVAIHADDLARAVANLLENCAVHAPGASVFVHGEDTGARYRLVVGDDGPGIDSDIAADVSHRGISTRDGGGLGLYSVRSLIESVGGSVSIDLNQGGTVIELLLPVASTSGIRFQVPAVSVP